MQKQPQSKPQFNQHNFAHVRILIFAAFLLVFFVTAIVVPAQNSDLEKKVYKTPPSTKKPASASNSGSKKTTPANKPASSTAQKKSNTARSGSSRASSKKVKFSFTTPEPNQEVWLGEQKLGISNENSILEKTISIGNYLVSVRDAAGEIVSKPQIVAVSQKVTNIELKRDTETPAENPPAEESLRSDSVKTLEASKKIEDILDRYGNPLTTNTVSLSDWEFIYNLAKTNQIEGLTAVSINGNEWFSSGQIELAKTNYTNAITAFKRSKEFMKLSALPDYGIGEAYMANGRSDEALKYYQNAVTIKPTFALGYAKIGDIYVGLKKEKDAVTSYKTAIETGYDAPSVRHSLSTQLIKLNRFDEAVVQLEIVLKDAPSGDVYITLGDAYKELKRPISAYEAYRRATELLPTSSVAFYKLGEILSDEREFEKSKAAMEKAATLDPTGKNINLALARKYIREAEQKLK